MNVGEKLKSGIRNLSVLFASREFGVVYCVTGTVAEIFHTYYLSINISSLTGYWKIIQAIMLSVFISSSLLYFVLTADNRDESERGKADYKRTMLAVNLFTVISIIINFYYYAREMLMNMEELRIFDFIFAVLISCLLPITIKLYANSIHVKDWIENPDEVRTDEASLHNYQEMIDKYLMEQANSEESELQAKFETETNQEQKVEDFGKNNLPEVNIKPFDI